MKTWFPPTSLTGKHWRLEVLHVRGDWVWYTEHLDRETAEKLCTERRANYPTKQWRIIEANR